jgi:hypothetical protein
MKKKINASDDSADDEVSLDGSVSPSGDKKRRRIAKPTVDYGISSDEEDVKSVASVASENPFIGSEKDSNSAFEGFGVYSFNSRSNNSEEESESEGESVHDEQVSNDGSENRFIPDQAAVLRTGARRRVSDDEDDGMMEVVPQCIINRQESPFELYPVIELIDLDKKIPARYLIFGLINKRVDTMEFEPIMNSTYKNISVTRANWRWAEHMEEIGDEAIVWPETIISFKPKWFSPDSTCEVFITNCLMSLV